MAKDCMGINFFFNLLHEGYLTASYKNKTIHIVLISKRSHKFIVQFHVIPRFSIFFFLFFYFLFFFQQSENRANSSRRVLQTLWINTRNVRHEISKDITYTAPTEQCRPNYHYVYNTGTTFILDREAATEISYASWKAAYLMSAGILRVTLLEIQPRLFNYSGHSLLVLPLIFLIQLRR